MEDGDRAACRVANRAAINLRSFVRRAAHSRWPRVAVGDRHVTLGYGYWGEESFSEARESCTAVIGGVRLRVFTFSEPGRTSLARMGCRLWSGTDTGYDIVLGYSSATPGDELLAKQIFASVAK